MKTGYFIPVSINYRLALLWGIIILSFERTLFYEFNEEGNWFLTILAIAAYIIFITLIWPHRFFITDGALHFAKFPQVQIKTIELKYITTVKKTKFGVEFSYSGKCYQFLTVGKSREALATLHVSIENSDKVSDLKV